MLSITVRPAVLSDCDQIASVHYQSWRETYDGLLPKAYIERQTFEDRQGLWKNALSAGIERRPFVFVAKSENMDLVGFSAAGKPFSTDFAWETELYAIYVMHSAQGHGIGRALLNATCQSLMDAGPTSLGIWVLKENRQAQLFYERFGAIAKSKHTENEDGTEIVDIAMGWDDIADLARQLEPSE